MRLLLAGILVFSAGLLVGQRTVTPQKTLVHAFAFQLQEGAGEAQVQQVWAATRKMAAAIPGIRNVWMGKVLNRGQEYQYGVVMEFENQAAVKAYAAHPAHKEWDQVYSKVRVEGTNTLDIQGE
jgi:heme-degrading monooxygenase HmoA